MMNKQQYDNYKSILATAPEGSDIFDKKQGFWDWPNRTKKPFDDGDLDTDYPDHPRQLSDLEDQCAQYERIEELEEKLALRIKRINLAIEIIDRGGEDCKFEAVEILSGNNDEILENKDG